MALCASFVAPYVLTSFQTVTFFTLPLNAYVDLQLLSPQPLELPVTVYLLPLLIYVGMNVLVLSFLHSYKADVRQLRSTSWIPAICTILTLISGLLTGLSFLEILLVVMPLTMSFIVLPWHLVLYRKHVLGADVDGSGKR
jgi:hypothetical protein